MCYDLDPRETKHRKGRDCAGGLDPILRDEIYRIAAEALRNAFHQAAAAHIEVELRYDH